MGVARQYCGRLGKVANCQQGVFAVYHSSKGSTFVDCRLYMPKKWFSDEFAPLRERCGVPPQLRFTTEPTLALDMVKTLVKRKLLPFKWVLGDETYGDNPKFLDGVAALGKYYFVEVAKTTQVYLGAVQVLPADLGPLGPRRKYSRVAPGTPPPVQVRQVANLLPPEAWELQEELQEGSKGPIQARIACLQVTRCQSKSQQRPGAPAWLILRQGLDPKTELKMFLSNAPSDASPQLLGRLTALRWPVETALLEAKSELGMDHYEVRSWRGWHHQMTLSFLAHHFLIRLQLSQKKKSCTDAAAGQGAADGGLTQIKADPTERRRAGHVSPTPQLRGISVASKAQAPIASRTKGSSPSLPCLVVVLAAFPSFPAAASQPSWMASSGRRMPLLYVLNLTFNRTRIAGLRLS